MESQIEMTRSHGERRAWRNAVFVIFTLSGFGFATWVARIPAVRDDLGLGEDTSAVGALLLAMAAGAVLGLMISAPTLARFGPHRGMVGSIAILTVGILLIGLGSTVLHSAPTVTAGLVLLGLGHGMLDVMMNVEGAAVERESAKTLMPLMHACFSLGTVLGAGAGTAAAALDIAVGWHMLCASVTLVVAALVAIRFIPREAALRNSAQGDPAQGDAAQGDPAAQTLRIPFAQRMRTAAAVWADGRLILIGVVMLGMAFGEGAANDWIALATVDGHVQANSTGAVVFGCFVAAMTIGRVAGGPLVNRIGRTAAIRITAGMGSVGLPLFIFGDPLWVVVAGAVLWGFGVSLGFPLGMSAAADGAGNPAARVSAVAIIGYCAFLVGPPVIGFLGREFGLLPALHLVLALLVASFLVAPAVRPHPVRPHPAAAAAEGCAAAAENRPLRRRPPRSSN